MVRIGASPPFFFLAAVALLVGKTTSEKVPAILQKLFVSLPVLQFVSRRSKTVYCPGHGRRRANSPSAETHPMTVNHLGFATTSLSGLRDNCSEDGPIRVRGVSRVAVMPALRRTSVETFRNRRRSQHAEFDASLLNAE